MDSAGIPNVTLDDEYSFDPVAWHPTLLIPKWLHYNRDLSLEAKWLYAYIWDEHPHREETISCTFHICAMSSWLRISEDSVRKAVKELGAYKLVKPKWKKGKKKVKVTFKDHKCMWRGGYNV